MCAGCRNVWVAVESAVIPESISIPESSIPTMYLSLHFIAIIASSSQPCSGSGRDKLSGVALRRWRNIEKLASTGI